MQASGILEGCVHLRQAQLQIASRCGGPTTRQLQAQQPRSLPSTHM